jgi:hypothetical protein
LGESIRRVGRTYDRVVGFGGGSSWGVGGTGNGFEAFCCRRLGCSLGRLLRRSGTTDAGIAPALELARLVGILILSFYDVEVVAALILVGRSGEELGTYSAF